MGLLDGIGDTMRISITGELEKEIEADLVSAVAEVEEKTKHIKAPLNVSVMGCVVNALGEAKAADVAIAYGKGTGLIIKKGETIAKLPTEELLDRFLQEVEEEARKAQ